jgi:hypothetical protein
MNCIMRFMATHWERRHCSFMAAQAQAALPTMREQAAHAPQRIECAPPAAANPGMQLGLSQ